MIYQLQIRVALVLATILFVLAPATVKADATLCVLLTAKTVDSGFSTPGGDTEDWYASCNDSCRTRARNVLIRMTQADGTSNNYYLDSNGCADVVDGPQQTLEVFSFARNSHGLSLRMHDGGTSFGADPLYNPGSAYVWIKSGIDLSQNTTRIETIVDYGEVMTTFAMAATVLHRIVLPYSLGTTIHLGLWESSGCTSSAHYGSVTPGGWVQSMDRVHVDDGYVVIARCGTQNHSRAKFVIAHEVGHAMLCLLTNQQGCEFNIDASVAGGGVCGDAPGISYSMGSREYDSIGFREGFAHLISARTWNDKDSTGQFYLGQSYNLEDYGDGNDPGGRLLNVCCGGSVGGCTDNYGTNLDWMNFLWDVYNNESGSCPYQPDLYEMANIFAYTVVATPANQSYYEEMRISAASLGGLPSCLADNTASSRIGVYAAHNGIHY